MMLYKTTLSSGYTDTPHIFPLDMHDFTILKAASEMHPDIMQYIQKIKPIPGKSIIVVDAMGAGEYWGSNVNGDYFAEDQLCHDGLDYGYKTFEHYAYPYIEHNNEASTKDPGRRVGERVQLSVYFKPMHRVQLIVVISKTDPRTSRVVDRIDAGEYPDVSMACGVQYDQCSICGSKHKTRREYCTHAKKMLNHVMDDGRKVFLYNHHPRFHDISMVFMGAEKNSKILLKVASMKKTVDANVTDIEFIPEQFDKKTLERLSKYELVDVMHAMKKRGFKMSPEDFQYLVLNNTGNMKNANILADNGVVFDTQQAQPLTSTPAGADNSLIDILIDQRPMYKQASQMMNKRAGQSIVAPVLAGLYHSFNQTVPNAINAVIREAQRSNVAGVALGYAMGHNIGMHLPRTQSPLSNLYQDPMLIPDYSTPYSSEPMFKFASPWGEVWNTVKGAGGMIYRHPYASGSLAAMFAAKIAADKEKTMGISTNDPYWQAAKYGGGLAGGITAIEYFRKKGLHK